MKYEIKFDGETYFEYNRDLGQQEIQYICKTYSVRLLSTKTTESPKGSVKAYLFSKIKST